MDRKMEWEMDCGTENGMEHEQLNRLEIYVENEIAIGTKYENGK